MPRFSVRAQATADVEIEVEAESEAAAIVIVQEELALNASLPGRAAHEFDVLGDTITDLEQVEAQEAM